MQVLASALSVVLLALVGLDEPAQRGGDAGQVAGVVKDATGAFLAAASIEIRSRDATLARSAATDSQGRFAFDSLPPGRYSVSAAAPGFERSVVDGVVVTAGAVATADFVLAVARRAALVEVTAPAGSKPLTIETDPRTPRQPIPAHDGADYLKTIPGFAVIRKGGADGDPVLRGMAGSRLGILLDGENVLGGCGNRMDPPTAYAFPEAYDRITVLKGPQTVAHGPGNSAGVVLFERDRERYSEPQLHAYASPTFGSFGRNDQVAEVKAGMSKGYVQASGTRSALGGYVDGSGRDVHSSYERWSANAALGWTPDELTRVEISGARSDGEAAYADRAMDGVRFSRENLALRLERRDVTRNLVGLEAHVYYNYVDHVMDNYSLRPFTPSMTMPNPSVSNPDRRTRGARIQASLALGSSTLSTVGGDWQDNRHTIRSSRNQPSDPFEAHVRARDATFENFGAFGELTQRLGARGRIVAGARADWWTGRDERQAVSAGMGPPAANPTANLARHETLASGFTRYERDIGPATTFYAGVGHAERAPDYWELVSKESASSSSAFETRPERTTQLDTGLLYRRGTVSASAAFFVNGISDFILIQGNYTKAAMPMPGTTSQLRKATITRNVDASAWGGEATFAWDATRRMKVDTSLAYVRGRNRTDGVPLAQLPPLEARLGLEYAAEAWSIGGLTRLVAAQRRFVLDQGNIVGQDLGPSSAFGVFSLNGAWRVARRAKVTAGVDNVFDRTYAEFISRAGAEVAGYAATTRVNEPGRTLWVKLDLRF